MVYGEIWLVCSAGYAGQMCQVHISIKKTLSLCHPLHLWACRLSAIAKGENIPRHGQGFNLVQVWRCSESSVTGMRQGKPRTSEGE